MSTKKALMIKTTMAVILQSNADSTNAVDINRKRPNEKSPNAIPAPLQAQQVVGLVCSSPIF